VADSQESLFLWSEFGGGTLTEIEMHQWEDLLVVLNGLKVRVGQN